MIVDLQTLVRQCQAERLSFIQRGERASPACVELVRRAFAGDQAAWAAFFTQVFHAEIRRFIEAAARRYETEHGIAFSADDHADALQETQLAFAHYAPRAPTLLHSGDLDPIIAYLKKCVMSAVSTVVRKLPPPSEVGLSDLVGGEEEYNEPASQPPGRRWRLPTQRDFTEEWANIQEIMAELQKILQSTLEALIADECFLKGMAPREFLIDYNDLLPGKDDAEKLDNLNQALRRIRLRAQKSPTFQKLQSTRRKSGSVAFLTYTVSVDSDPGEAMMADAEPCVFDEATLLEYIQGKTPAEVSAAIERSPACIAAARDLSEDVAVLTQLLRLAPCPNSTTLIDYYAKLLPSAQQLVIHNHVQRCRQCQAELAMFAAIDEVSLQAEPSFVRRIIEAFFVAPTLTVSPIRGSDLLYRTQVLTPQLDILIRSSTTSGKPRRWTVRIDLRTIDGLRFTGIEEVFLQPWNQAEAEPLLAVRDEDGTYVIRSVGAKRYSLHILTSAEEIIVRELVVGEI